MTIGVFAPGKEVLPACRARSAATTACFLQEEQPGFAARHNAGRRGCPRQSGPGTGSRDVPPAEPTSRDATGATGGAAARYSLYALRLSPFVPRSCFGFCSFLAVNGSVRVGQKMTNSERRIAALLIACCLSRGSGSGRFRSAFRSHGAQSRPGARCRWCRP